MDTACVAPGAGAGVMLNDVGLTDRPVTTAKETAQATPVVTPLVRVTTTLDVVLEPATTLALVGFQATLKKSMMGIVNANPEVCVTPPPVQLTPIV
jgi:hypothetical protein